MAVLEILRWPDARLSAMCAPVSGNVNALAADMLETMYDAQGRGLAAPQVGHLIRVFVMDVTWKEGAPTPIVMVNPVITAQSETVMPSDEGCLSIPGILASVDRPAEVTIEWQGATGQDHKETLTGFAARCAQHELDHLNGIVTFDRISPKQRARLEADYAG